ncbi:MAG: hypothetical protein GY786_18450 [Proteobacteria bacterium]|nr:hypothetical protein [Pseudomonadota bacterium]
MHELETRQHSEKIYSPIERKLMGYLSKYTLIYLLLFLLAFQSGNVLFAQFNNSLEIERHFLGEENFLDWRAYQQPIPMRERWSRTKNGMRATTGSFSMEYFYLDHEIRYQVDLGKYASLLYHQEAESIFQDNPIYQEVEIRFWKDPYFGIAGYPQYAKKHDDFGYVISTGNYYGDFYLRYSRIYQDELFNEKNVEDDKNSSEDSYKTLPVFNRFQAKMDRAEFLLQVDLKLVEPTRYDSQADNLYKNYQQSDAEIDFHWKYDAKKLIGTSIRFKSEERSHQLITQTSYQKEQLLRLGNLDLFHHQQFSDQDYLTIGVISSTFLNRIDALNVDDRYLFEMDFNQIYIFWQDSLSDWLEMIYSVQVGNLLLSKEGVGVESENREEIQAKSGIGVVMFETDNYHFFVNTTWDLDDFLDRQWDGGNIQLQTYF